MACDWCEQLRLNIPTSRLDFPRKRRIVTSIDASTARLVSSSTRNLRLTALRVLSALVAEATGDGYELLRGNGGFLRRHESRDCFLAILLRNSAPCVDFVRARLTME